MLWSSGHVAHGNTKVMGGEMGELPGWIRAAHFKVTNVTLCGIQLFSQFTLAHAPLKAQACQIEAEVVHIRYFLVFK
jgi:hypothetical protein